MQHETILNPLSLTVIDYKNGILNRVQKNQMYTTIEKMFIKYVQNVITKKNIPQCHWNDVYSAYTDIIMDSIDKWTGKSNFTTYLFQALRGIYREYTKRISVVNQAGHQFNVSLDNLVMEDDE